MAAISGTGSVELPQGHVLEGLTISADGLSGSPNRHRSDWTYFDSRQRGKVTATVEPNGGYMGSKAIRFECTATTSGWHYGGSTPTSTLRSEIFNLAIGEQFSVIWKQRGDAKIIPFGVGIARNDFSNWLTEAVTAQIVGTTEDGWQICRSPLKRTHPESMLSDQILYFIQRTEVVEEGSVGWICDLQVVFGESEAIDYVEPGTKIALAAPYETGERNVSYLDMQGNVLGASDALTIGTDGHATINGTIDLGYIELPDIRDASTLSVIADVEPEIEVATSEYSIAGGGASMNGRNLLRFTGSPTYAGDNTAANRQLGWCRWNSAATIERTSDGIKYTHNAASSNLSGFVVPLISETLLQGGEDEVLTLSFQYRGNLTGKTALYLLANTGGNVQRRTNVEFAGDETEWHTFTDTVYFPTLGTRYATALLVPYSRDGKWLEIKDSTMKLEYGTAATPWRPAPEDTEQPSDVVYASEGVDLGDTSGLDNRLTTAESTIKQQAGQIALKANAADVNTKAETTALLEVKANKATLTSEINASADTVKIDANRVNITGEAVFSAINDDTGTTRIDGGKIDATSITIGQSQVTGLTNALDGKASTADVANAAKTATNYIALDPVNGIRIADANPDTATTYQKQTSTSTEFVVDGISMAEFGGSGARVGDADSTHVSIDRDSFDIVNASGNTVAYAAEDKFYADKMEAISAIYLGRYSLRVATDGKLVIGRRY